MHKRARIAVPILIVIIAVLYVTVFRDDEENNRLIMSGNIEVTDAQLSFRIPGRLTERLVDEGERVEAGQTIAKLDSTDQELLVAQAEASVALAQAVLDELLAGSRPEDISRVGATVAQARARLDELESGSRDQEIAVAEAELERATAGEDAARSQLELATADLDRYTTLYDEGVASLRELEAMQTQYDLALSSHQESGARVAAAREGLSLRQEGARPEQIAQARAVLQQAQAAYSLVAAGPRAETIEQAEAQLEIANEALRMAVQQLDYTVLAAPFDGVVLSKSVEPGEWLNPGSAVVTVGDLDTVYLRAYINETDLGRLVLGQTVEVTTDTYPDKVYGGTVIFISSESEFTPKVVQTFEERVKLMYLVKIELENPNQELKPGMPADCVIDLEG